jgi:outer membrane immunogenic protein
VLLLGDGISGGIGYIGCRIWSARAAVPEISDASRRSEHELENNMKKILLGTVALIALGMAAPASAADLAARPYTKAPAPMIAAIYDWSGFYIGLNGGGGSARKCWDFVTPAGTFVGAEGCHSATGGTVGGQIGYRWQASNWVFGLEAQGNWANFKGSNTNTWFAATTDQSKVNAFGLFTGQVGYAWNNALFYVKGGAAVASDKYATYGIPAGLIIDSASETRWGGTIGAGLEFGFAPNWSVGLEYDHMFLGTRNITAVTPAGAFSATDRISQGVDIGTVRLNYRFGGPVVARY